MNVVFADTFYWIAFTNVQDVAHERVKTFTRAGKPDLIVTTEEVLTEYLNYFAGWAHTRKPNSENCAADAGLIPVGFRPLSNPT